MARAAAGAAGDHGEPGASSVTATRPLAAALASACAAADVLYRFSRPHTMCGTTISVLSVCALAAGDAALSQPALAAAGTALVPALLANVAIVGLNQISDVEIDKINKPYLPLAAGDLSMGQAWAIVAACTAASLWLGAVSGSVPLLATLSCSLALGVAYSMPLPGLRWKRSPWLAAMCILAVRAVAVQAGFFLHARGALGAPADAAALACRPLAFATGFMLLFSVVIALFKDIPDVRGDASAGVRTFSVRHGPGPVYWACTGLLLAAYAAGVCFGLSSPEPWARLPVAIGHAALGALLWARSVRVDEGRTSQLADHYMFIWRLFYAEYLLLPLLR